MSPGIIVLIVLSATLALCGGMHLLAWRIDRLARERLWFGLGSLAAAGAIGVYVTSPAEPPVAGAVQQSSTVLAMGWGMAMAWFTAEYSEGGAPTRGIAGVVTLLFTLALVQTLTSSTSPAPGLLLALLGLALLVAAGSIRLWRSRARLRALTLGAGLGMAIVEMAGYGLLLEMDIVRIANPVPHAFIILALLVSYELAFSLEAAHATAARRQQGLAHISRLAVVGELTAAIAHEINQPLGAILSNAEAGEFVLERDEPSSEELRQILQDIRRDGLRATNVIQQIRTLVRGQELVLEKLDANEVAGDAIGLIAPEARRRRVALELLPSTEPVYVRGDKGRLEQVFINLLINALDAMELEASRDALVGIQRPVVMEVARRGAHEVEFRITDQGHGIPPERLDRLFDSFFTSKSHGMGMGLSIARSLVEAHGGWIRAENNPSGGATFRVTLPAFKERRRHP